MRTSSWPVVLPPPMTGKHNTHNIIIIISDVISIKCEQCIRLLSIAEKGTDTVQCTNGGSELKPLLRRYTVL